MTECAAADAPWVIVRLGSELYGLSASCVREMVSLPEVCKVPEVPEFVRGVVNLRGQVLSLLDLRRRLGRESASAELDQLLAHFDAREQDHVHWVTELETSITEGRPFGLTLDPHACAFGRWYDGLQTDNVVLKTQLKRIEGPHQSIHLKGGRAAELAAHGEREAALAVASDVRSHDLKFMLQLFGELKVALRESQREIAIVLTGRNRTFGAVVDSVESVERVDVAREQLEDLIQDVRSGAVRSVARRARDGRLLMLLDVDQLAM